MTKQPVKELELDLIEETAKEIETMSLKDIVTMIPDTVEDRGLQSFRLGGMLSRAKRDSEKFFQATGKPFAKWVESEIGFSKSKAYALAAVYDNLVEINMPWSEVSDIGWTKLALIAKELKKAKKPHRDKLIAAARQSSYDELQRSFSAMPKSKPKEKDKKPEKKILALFPDQWETACAAADKVKAGSGHKTDNSRGIEYWIDAALQSYLNFVPAKKPPTLANMMKAAGPEAALKAFKETWPDFDIKAALPE
jgi:hypothetical protein